MFYVDFSQEKHGIEFSFHSLDQEDIRLIYCGLKLKWEELRASGGSNSDDAQKLYLLMKEIESNIYTHNTGKKLINCYES